MSLALVLGAWYAAGIVAGFAFHFLLLKGDRVTLGDGLLLLVAAIMGPVLLSTVALISISSFVNWDAVIWEKRK